MSVVTTRNAWWQVLSTTNYTWDAAGNMTGEGATSFQYDAASRLKTVNNGTTETNGFDGDSQRVKKVEGSVTVFYVRSSVMKQTAFEVGGNGALYRANVYKSQNRLVAQLASDGSFYWQHKNHLGSGYKLTNSAGAVVYRAEHDPHGQLLLETGSTTLTANKFTSYERDNSTGLDYANARMYASARGRFTSPDPSGMQYINTRNPESLNRYAYTGNDPVNYIDPTGLVRVFDEDICEKWGFLFPEAAKEWGCGTGNSDPRTKDGGRGGSSGGVGATYPNVRFNEIHVSVIREIVQPNNYGVASLAFPTQEFCEEGATYELKIDVGYESIREFIQSESKVRAKGDIKILEYSFDFLNSSGDGLGEVYIKFSFKDKSVASSRIGVEVGFVGKTHDKAKGNNGLSIIVSCKT
jgi:RHS repeat-associated protein